MTGTQSIPLQNTQGEWSYERAFSRNLGLITPDEQQRLRKTRVAIVGMGGVGGVHLLTLARLGVGNFHIADPDTFEAANFNRQVGATLRSLGRSKVEVMAEEALAINPELQIRQFRSITTDNVGDFLEGVDILLDGIDFFEIDMRRRLFQEARSRGAWGVTAGPLGFSTAYLSFSPTGMSFEDYFDFREGMSPLDKIIAFAVGLAPRATQAAYMDLTRADPKAHRGPSAGLACQLCSGVAAAEILKIVLQRGALRPVPSYAQFDAYRACFRRGTMWWGNRHPLQRLKRFYLGRLLRRLGWEDGVNPPQQKP